jgi:hypothetical protein
MSYRSLGQSIFWTIFSSGGRKLNTTRILDKMRKARLAEDKVLADKARLEYGNRFEDVFCYRKGNTEVKDNSSVVMSMPSAIARHYRARHGLIPQNFIATDYLSDRD